MIELGKIVGVWGVKGWIKIHSYTRVRSDIGSYKNWYLQSPKDRKRSFDGIDADLYEVVSCRQQGPGIVAQLGNIDSRDKAEALIGSKIFVAEDDLPTLSNGEFYWHQLIGLRVDYQGQTIGLIKAIMETGANDVLVCDNAVQGKEDVLIPYTESAVLAVDLDKNVMTVDWDPTYLE